MKRWLALALLAAVGGMGFGELGWGLRLQDPAFLWPLLSRPEFWAAGALLGLVWMAVLAFGWKLAFDLPWIYGARAGVLGALAGLVGWLWPHFARPILPYPHDLPVRSLELLGAGLALGGLLLGLIAAGVACARGPWKSWPLRSLGLRLFGILWIFFTLGGTWTLSWHSTGDDVHYLLMAHSLARHGSLDMAAAFEHREYRLFHDRELTPQYPPLNGHLYTEHKPGIAVLGAPAYALAGAPGVQWVQAAWAAATAALAFVLMIQLGLARGPALMAFGSLALSAPIWLHSTAIYPELPGGLLLLLVFASGAGLWAPAWAVLGLAGLPWMSVRFYPLIGVASLALLWAWRRRWRWALAVTALPALSLLAGAWLNRVMFGGFSPAAAYRLNKGAIGMADLFRFDRMLQQGGGLLLDQEVGLLVYAPWFLLALPGCLAWWRRSPRTLAWAGLLMALYLAPVCAYFEWHGSMAPARYLVCVAPLLALAAAQAHPRVLAWPLKALLVLWTLGAAYLQAVLPWLAYSGLDGRNRLLAAFEPRLGLPLTRYMPSFIIPNAAAWVSLAVLAIFCAVLARRQLDLQGPASAPLG